MIATGRYNQTKVDRTTWHAIDDGALEGLLESADDLIKMSNSTGQNEQVEEVNLSKSVPETNQETTAEKKRPLTLDEIDAHEKRMAELDRWIHPERQRRRKT